MTANPRSCFAHLLLAAAVAMLAWGSAVPTCADPLSTVQPVTRNIAESRPYVLLPPPSETYADPSGRKLTDGIRGATDDPKRGWVGFDHGQPSIIFDLGTVNRVDRIQAGFMSLPGSGVHLPTEVRISRSFDGRHWTMLRAVPPTAVGETLFEAGTDVAYARYIRLEPARNEWLLMDEVKVFGTPAPAAGLLEPVPGVAVITDAADAYDTSVDRLENLLDGMGLSYDRLAPGNVARSDLTHYQLLIVAPSSGGRFALDEAFGQALARAARDGVNLLWIGGGIWGASDLPETFGLRFVDQRWSVDLGVAKATFINLAGDTDKVGLHQEMISRVQPVSASIFGSYLDATDQPTSIPFVTEHRDSEHAGRTVFISVPLLDFWKYAEAPDTFARAEVLYTQILRLTDAGIVGKDAVRDAKDGTLTIRLEDYTPGGSAMAHDRRLWLIRMQRLLETTQTDHLPLNIALVPRYAHPARNEFHDWASEDPAIATLRHQAAQALTAGGAFIVHGYKHQNGSGPDDFSGDDYEMWDEDTERFLPADEQQAITNRAYAEVTEKWRVIPKIWETPHYRSNEDTYKAAAASGFVYVNESDTKLFPNRSGYLGHINGHLLNVPETGFNFPLDPKEIKASTLVKQLYLLPRFVRLQAPFNFFYHNSSPQQEKALRNFLTTAARYNLWTPNLEDLAVFWERRERAKVASSIDPLAGVIVAEVSDGFPGLALVVRLPDGTWPTSVTVNNRPADSASRKVNGVWLVEPVLPGTGTQRVVVKFMPRLAAAK